MSNLGPDISDEILEEARLMLSQGRSTEAILALLKTNGANAIASIHALQILLGIPVRQAQQILHDSETWREMR